MNKCFPFFFFLNKPPYHLLYDNVPDKHDLKVFGSLCYASTFTSHRTKFQPRARKCLFLGYRSGIKGYVYCTWLEIIVMNFDFLC